MNYEDMVQANRIISIKEGIKQAEEYLKVIDMQVSELDTAEVERIGHDIGALRTFLLHLSQM